MMFALSWSRLEETKQKQKNRHWNVLWLTFFAKQYSNVALLFPSLPFPFHFSFSKIKNYYFLPFSLLFPSTFKSLKKWGVEGNSNFKIAISFHFFLDFNNCYFLPFWLLFPSTFLKLLFPSTFLYEWRC